MTANRKYDYGEVYTWIVDFKRKNNGLAPSFREIQEEFQISSLSVVYYILNVLVSQELITYEEHVARSIRVPDLEVN